MDKDIVILVVEDDALQREIVLDQLEIAGYEEAIGMEDGVEAYSYIEENPADLIISDWSMPNMDGLELLKKIRSNPSLNNLPFIMLTANEDVTKKAMDAGASGFLSKPTNPAKLIEKIEKIFD
jgi:two-component system chemotaxis response regulator CheY